MTTRDSSQRGSRNTSDERFEAYSEAYTLKRYPARHRPELRAWDTADRYLLETLKARCPEARRICVVHDQFGALTLPLLGLSAHFDLPSGSPLDSPRDQPLELICYGDSWMSRRALELNIELNSGFGLELKGLTFEESLDNLVSHPAPECVIGRIPKSSSQLAYLLELLNVWVDEGTPLMLAGMDKHLSRGQYELLERRFGPAQFLPGVKKARVWIAHCDKQIDKQIDKRTSETRLELAEHQLSLSAGPNVFSGGRLDIGSRLFLKHFDQLPRRERVADVGCGYGVLGLAYLRLHPQAHITLCDESFQAVASTRANLAYNFPNMQADVRAHVYADDGLKQVEPESLELVLCNPPFHQGHTVSADIAHSMFHDAHRALSSAGELWVIANRHLGYHVKLKALFGRCEVKASDRKFTLLRAVKR